jgi:hypothetical protein
MAVSYAEGKIEVDRLVEQFARNVETYKRLGYKEARVRVEFVEPFVAALPRPCSLTLGRHTGLRGSRRAGLDLFHSHPHGRPPASALPECHIDHT